MDDLDTSLRNKQEPCEAKSPKAIELEPHQAHKNLNISRTLLFINEQDAHQKRSIDILRTLSSPRPKA